MCIRLVARHTWFFGIRGGERRIGSRTGSKLSIHEYLDFGWTEFSVRDSGGGEGRDASPSMVWRRTGAKGAWIFGNEIAGNVAREGTFSPVGQKPDTGIFNKEYGSIPS